MLKRLAVPLDRDVIFLAESGEEADTTWVGINFMVREHFDEIDAEFAMTEGGGATVEGTRVTRVSIGTAEKLPVRARLVATGTAGHGSVPRLDNALIHLGAAVDKVGRWETPMRLNDTTRAYFEKLATVSTPERAAIYKALLDPKTAAGAQTFLREHSQAEYSMLRTSVVPTVLKAGVGVNVIPSEAEATLDIRALPGEDVERFYAEMAKVIGDPAVKIVPIPPSRPPSPASRIDTEMYRVMERVAKTVYPDAIVLPSMSTGASDQAQLRAKGIQSYGIGPAATEADSINYPAHGDVERLAESSLYPFVEYVWRVVTEVAAQQIVGWRAHAGIERFSSQCFFFPCCAGRPDSGLRVDELIAIFDRCGRIRSSCRPPIACTQAPCTSAVRRSSRSPRRSVCRPRKTEHPASSPSARPVRSVTRVRPPSPVPTPAYHRHQTDGAQDMPHRD